MGLHTLALNLLAAQLQVGASVIPIVCILFGSAHRLHAWKVTPPGLVGAGRFSKVVLVKPCVVSLSLSLSCHLRSVVASVTGCCALQGLLRHLDSVCYGC